MPAFEGLLEKGPLRAGQPEHSARPSAHHQPDPAVHESGQLVDPVQDRLQFQVSLSFERGCRPSLLLRLLRCAAEAARSVCLRARMTPRSIPILPESGCHPDHRGAAATRLREKTLLPKRETGF